MASSLVRAVPGTLMWDGVRTSLMGSPRMWCGRPAPGHPGAGRPVGSTRGALRVGCLQLLDDRVVLGAVHEVVDRDVLCRRRHGPGPRREVLVRDDQVDVVG